MQKRQPGLINSDSALVVLQLLGPLQITVAERTVSLSSKKVRGLLAYLALRLNQPVPRETLTGLFWGDREDDQARASLRQALTALRKSLGANSAAMLTTTNETVTLAGDGIWVDLLNLERADKSSTLAELLVVAKYCRGEFLEGLSLNQAGFDHWLSAERQRARELEITFLSELVDRLAEDQQFNQAISYGSKLLTIDPLQENVHRKLMAMFMAQGRYDVALQQYEQCRKILLEQLNVDPDTATAEMVKQIRIRRQQAAAVSMNETSSVSLDQQTTAFESAIGLDFELPDTPSIAVLPFADLSANGDQEFFADGIVEDIIVAMSKISRLMVISRNSSFTYRNCAVSAAQVSRELGVRYVLEGSVRKAANRVRVTTQLIDATTGSHLWAEKYDRELDDIFAVQDEITREIVVAMDVQLREGEQHRVWSSGTKNIEAWECVRLATHSTLGGSAAEQPGARDLLERALALDPNYATAWAMRGWLHFTEADVGGGLMSKDQFERGQAAAFDCGQRALDIDPDCSEAYGLLALTHLNAGNHDEAMKSSEKALMLAPNNAEILGGVVSAVLRNSGQRERGAELVKQAMRLGRFYRPGLLRALGNNYRMITERLEDAVICYRESIKRQSGYLAVYVNLASVLGELGRVDEAQAAARDVLAQEPNFSIQSYAAGLSFRNPEDLQRVVNGLHAAGLPE